MADTEYMYELKIPKDRVAVLIGVEGAVKKQIEEATGTKLDIDSTEGDVFIKGSDSINLYATREIVKALGRGFNPDVALLLLKQEYALEIVNLRDFADEKAMLRLKGRVIGRDGRARKNIELLTESYISVYGKTISVIGECAKAFLARKAVETLLTGSTHATVYKFLERNRRELKRKELIGEN
jgi:ribosomal RNA assembly protein